MMSPVEKKTWWVQGTQPVRGLSGQFNVFLAGLLFLLAGLRFLLAGLRFLLAGLLFFWLVKGSLRNLRGPSRVSMNPLVFFRDPGGHFDGSLRIFTDP